MIRSGAAAFGDHLDRFAELHDPWAESPPLTDPLLLYVHANRKAVRALFEGDPAQARYCQQQAPRGDFYVRQFHDMKGGIDADVLDDGPFQRYAEACAATLARAHAQSRTAGVVAGYIGNGDAVGQAILEWAYAYAALSKGDYDAFVAALGAESEEAGARTAGEEDAGQHASPSEEHAPDGSDGA